MAFTEMFRFLKAIRLNIQMQTLAYVVLKYSL